MTNHKEIKQGEGSAWFRIASSTVFFMVAFIGSNLYLQSIIAVLSRLFRYSVIFRYNHVTSLPTDPRFWNVSKIMAIYFTAPMICLLTALILFFFVFHNSLFHNRFRLFIFWLIVCLSNIFLSHLIFTPFGLNADARDLYLTFAIAATWLRVPYAALLVIAGLSIIATMIWGVVLGNELRTFSPQSRFSPSLKTKILLAAQLYLFPWLLSLAPLFLLSTEHNLLPTIITIFNLGLLGGGILGRNSTYTAAATMKQGKMFGANIEIDSMRGFSAKTTRSRAGSLNKFPKISLVVFVILWVVIYFKYK